MLNFFKKPKSLLKEEDVKELIEIERTAYMDEARAIMKERGKQKAKSELIVPQKKEGLF